MFRSKIYKALSNRNVDVGLAIVAILIAYLSWQYPKHISGVSEAPYKGVQASETFSKAILTVSGTGVKIHIQASANGLPLQNTVISGTGTNQSVYLPRGQALSLMLTGTGIQVLVDRNIAPQVQVSNYGTGNNAIVN